MTMDQIINVGCAEFWAEQDEWSWEQYWWEIHEWFGIIEPWVHWCDADGAQHSLLVLTAWGMKCDLADRPAPAIPGQRPAAEPHRQTALL